MGGLGRLHYTAIRGYAKDFGIRGTQFDWFLTFMNALDDEYVAYVIEEQKAESEKTK